MNIKRLSFFILIFFSLASPAFSWQLSPYEKGTDVFIEDEQGAIFNLVFTHLNYEEKEEFQKDVGSMVDILMKTPPFDEFKALKIYFLETKPEEESVLFKNGEKFPFLKIRDDLVKEVKEELNAPYKLVVLDKKGSVTAAELSDIDKISVIVLGKNRHDNEARFTKAFLHEFGHALGLREENPHSSHLIIPGPPNCAPDKENAIEWWGDMVGKVEGAGYFEIRSGGDKFIILTPHSIMNNPYKSDTYGAVNERYLRKELGLKK